MLGITYLIKEKTMTQTLLEKQAYPATSFVGGKWQQEIDRKSVGRERVC